MRKPRSDSPLRALAPAIQKQVATLCAEQGFEKAAPLAARLTGLASGVSPSALQRWHAWWRVQTALDRQRDEAIAFEDLLKDRPDIALDTERARAVAQLYFERQILESADPKLYLAWQKQQLDRDKFDLLRSQAAAAKEALADPALQADPAAQAAKVRQIFGLPAAAPTPAGAAPVKGEA